MIQAYAVWIDGVVDGVIRTADAKERAKKRAAKLRKEGKNARARAYNGPSRSKR